MHLVRTSNLSRTSCATHYWHFALTIIALICLLASGRSLASGTEIHSFKFIGLDKNSDDPNSTIAGTNVLPAPRAASIEVRYSYDGSKGQAYMGAKPKSRNGISGSYYERAILPGQEQIQVVLMTKPEAMASQIETDSIEIFIYTKKASDSHLEERLAIKTFDWPIRWPERNIRDPKVNQSKESYNRDLLADAIAIIDDSAYNGRRDLAVAKRNLDTIISDDPSNVQAYLELARIAMKSDYSANESKRYVGLDEAHRLIKVALRINPEYANSYILFGYVLAVTGRTDEAIVAFNRAQKIGTTNMWLYYNWGLALENAGRTDKAINKYREGIALTPVADTPETHSNNRAIPNIFSNLIGLLEGRNDLAAIDVLYQKRLALFDESCQKTKYAEFKLYRMGDYDAAIQLVSRAQEQNCRAGARPLLAVAYLTKWALDPSKLADSEREKLLNRGQAFISDTQQTIVDLASSKNTAKALLKLRTAGIGIDDKNASGMTPLAYAAGAGKADAVKALIDAGADPNVVLEQGWTPLMIAVASNHASVVKVLLRANVSIEKKTASGQDAISIARMAGYTDIVKLLGSKNQL